MNQFLKRFIVLAAATLLMAMNAGAQPAWTPPAPRNLKTPFAPKPHKGKNIFTGEADVWLAEAAQQMCCDFDPVDDEAVTQYVATVGAYVATYSQAPAKEYRFIVTDASYPDAFSIGGGRIYVTEGLLKILENEDQLAGILAHEIAHDAFGHQGKTMTRQMFWMLGIKRVENRDEVKAALERLQEKYAQQPVAKLGETMLGVARIDELEADRAAFYDTYKAGYNPAGLSEALKLIARDVKQQQGDKRYWRDELLMLLFASHPPDTQRFLALSWEGNFVKMPPRDTRFNSPAFAAMKKRLADKD